MIQHPDPLLCEEFDRVGREAGSGGREYMYAYSLFMLVYCKNHHNTVKKQRNFTTADTELWSILLISIM